MVKKYKPVSYLNGHDHALVYAAKVGYSSQFFTTGASLLGTSYTFFVERRRYMYDYISAMPLLMECMIAVWLYSGND